MHLPFALCRKCVVRFVPTGDAVTSILHIWCISRAHISSVHAFVRVRTDGFMKFSAPHGSASRFVSTLRAHDDDIPRVICVCVGADYVCRVYVMFCVHPAQQRGIRVVQRIDFCSAAHSLQRLQLKHIERYMSVTTSMSNMLQKVREALQQTSNGMLRLCPGVDRFGLRCLWVMRRASECATRNEHDAGNFVAQRCAQLAFNFYFICEN